MKNNSLAHYLGNLIGCDESLIFQLSKLLEGGDRKWLGTTIRELYVSKYDEKVDKQPMESTQCAVKTAVAWRLAELAGLNSIERYKLARVLHRRAESAGFIIRNDLGATMSSEKMNKAKS